MSSDPHMVGGAPVGVLDRLPPWESRTVMNLRLWCEGPEGRAEVRAGFETALPLQDAEHQCRAFERLLQTILQAAHRPLVRHDVGCGCMGADEGVFLHLIRTAAMGRHRDAALIATLLVGPSEAEAVALLASKVGLCAKYMHACDTTRGPARPAPVVRLH
ncbi:MAG: hypothetical protein AAF744_06055 [Pseudomonadota bacterium]